MNVYSPSIDSAIKLFLRQHDLDLPMFALIETLWETCATPSTLIRHSVRSFRNTLWSTTITRASVECALFKLFARGLVQYVGTIERKQIAAHLAKQQQLYCFDFGIPRVGEAEFTIDGIRFVYRLQRQVFDWRHKSANAACEANRKGELRCIYATSLEAAAHYIHNCISGGSKTVKIVSSDHDVRWRDRWWRTYVHGVRQTVQMIQVE